MNNPDKLRYLITIVDRGKAKKVTKILSKHNIHKWQVILGRGTAPIDIYNILGLGDSEKDVIMCVIKLKKLEEVYNDFNTILHFDKPGKGISLAIPVTTVASRSALENLLH